MTNKYYISIKYRPISVLTGLSKVFERIINNRLTKYLENNKLLSDQQFGFRPKRSTSQAVHKLTNFISSNLDNGMYTIGIFLDLAKAFDTISFSILIFSLILWRIYFLYLNCKTNNFVVSIQIINYQLSIRVISMVIN